MNMSKTANSRWTSTYHSQTVTVRYHTGVVPSTRPQNLVRLRHSLWASATRRHRTLTLVTYVQAKSVPLFQTAVPLASQDVRAEEGVKGAPRRIEREMEDE